MAEGAVTFLLEKLDNLLKGELSLLSKVQRETRFIKDELQSMRAFLRDADRRQESNESIKVWIEQVRQVAYDTEDVLDEFLLTLPQKLLLVRRQQQEEGRRGTFMMHHHRLQKTAWFIKNWMMYHQMRTKIKEIKGRVEEISNRSNRYHVINSTGHTIDHQRHSSSSTTPEYFSSVIHDPRSDALLLEDDEIVGIDNIKDDLIHQILARTQSRLDVTSVVGMGGLGKTTLVKRIYDDPRIMGGFDYQAWVTVSQSFKVVDLLRDTLEQLYENENRKHPNAAAAIKQLGGMILDHNEMNKLKNEVKSQLQNKRYVIVLDDIWNMGAWDALKYVFPNSNCGNRIVITTRFKDIGKACGQRVFELQPLPEQESWKLFCMKAFQSNTSTCPNPQLELLSKAMLQRCEGLPLAIVTLGSLLASKEKTITEWEIVFRSLGVELQSNDHLGHVKRILHLSYIDLPYYLKYCFLYLSIFPEDQSIECKKLVRLWSIERLIEEKRGMTIEEAAESYLRQLINRSLIQIRDTHSDGMPRTCRVHDLVREIFLSKSIEEGFGAIVASDQNASSHIPKNIRRLSVDQNGGYAAENIVNTMMISSSTSSSSNNSFSNLRSLFVFDGSALTTRNSSSVPFLSGDGPRLLRVLDLNGAPLVKFPKEVVNLIHLRYLSMRSTKLESIPNSIGKLQNLEILDLKETNISNLPITGIRKLKRLRYLAVYCYKETALGSYLYHIQGLKAFKGIGDLASLQKLSWIEVDNKGSDRIIEELTRLRQLRRLGVLKLKLEDGIHLCSSIEKMTHLQSLSVSSLNEGSLDMEHLTLPPSHLQRIYLEGKMGAGFLPRWICSLDSLVKLVLCSSGLRIDALDSIQNLPNLASLRLVKAYDHEQLAQSSSTTVCFKQGGFQKLEHLELRSLVQLQVIQVEEGALCHLQRLYIYGCCALRTAPLGIQRLTQLKVLQLANMSDEFLSNIHKEGVEGPDYWRIAHLSSIYVRKY